MIFMSWGFDFMHKNTYLFIYLMYKHSEGVNSTVTVTQKVKIYSFVLEIYNNNDEIIKTTRFSIARVVFL